VNNLRLWVGILSLTCFLAGLACAPFVSAWILPPNSSRAEASFADYEAMLVQTFKLSPERREPLRTILGQYRQDIERIKDSHMADYMSSMEPELREVGLRYREQIRDRVLPEALRPEFDRLASSLPTSQPVH